MKVERRNYLTACKHTSVNRMSAGLRLPRSSPSFIYFQTHFVQLQVFVRPAGIQALPHQ